jgi:hypothetical protein
MKKIIIGLSGLAILAIAIVLFVNAKSNPQEVKKAATEISKDCANCPSAATCTTMAEKKDAACDMTKCKDAKCDMTKCKEGKCDPATCKTKCEGMKGDMKNCDMSKCTTACPMKAPAVTK